MIVEHYTDISAESVTMAGAEKVSIRWLLGKDSPAPNFYLRLFEVQPGGRTPYHAHPYEHEIFVLEGRGRINAQEGSQDVASGAFALVMPDEEHQFENAGQEPLKFLCLIPTEK
ncbi:MAG: cupin domain-containing protein [Candidatus Aminicenantes bacterium]|nr:cupin domain-containing protein [Candidatus Aminicenantes bacterium]